MSGSFVSQALAPQIFQAREQRVYGLVTAKVEKIEDDGTYRLKFHGMNGQDDDDHSAPARVMAPMAGGNRGFHFFPEKGDEVVVAFQNGDTNLPFILGAVWNRDDHPPRQARQSAQNDVRTVVSRSGHELTFDDAKGGEQVTLKTQGGHQIVLDDAPGGPKITIQSSGGRTVVIDDTPPGKISLQTPTCQVDLQDPGAIRIQATASIELSAPSITISGQTIAVTGSAGTVIDQVPFLLHVHMATAPAPPPAVSGPVNPA